MIDAMSAPDLIVYHDGSCPVCRMEIGRYRRSAGAERIKLIDVANPDVDPGPDLPREDVMGRFHVRLPSGELKAGAAAFVEIWRVLTFWRPAAMIASLPGATPALELGYRLVSPLRPAAVVCSNTKSDRSLCRGGPGTETAGSCWDLQSLENGPDR